MHVKLQVLKLKEMWAYYNNVMQHLTHDENVKYCKYKIILLLTALSVFKPLKLFSSQFVLIIQNSVI